MYRDQLRWLITHGVKFANGKTKYVVMFGVVDDRKARAARFEASQEQAVRKAADFAELFVWGCLRLIRRLCSQATTRRAGCLKVAWVYGADCKRNYFLQAF